jgi:PhnB protein
MENGTKLPKGYHSMMLYLNVKDADKAIEFYKKAFGAKEVGRLTVPGNKVGHAELAIGDSHFMLAEEMPDWGNKSPQTIGGSPVGICLYVDDVDTVFKQALDAGATIKDGMDVKDQFYGDRSGNLTDPFGHNWIVATFKEEISYEELQKRSDKMMAEPKK